MEFSEHELTVMRSIADEETLALIKKIFVDMPSANLAALDKNIVALDDAEYGQLMKVKHLTKVDNQSRIDFIKKQTKERKEKKDAPHAPR
jgi:hypothetical protein